jgi:mannose-6-phosphate isomerase-like protein (cupin superfamily)
LHVLEIALAVRTQALVSLWRGERRATTVSYDETWSVTMSDFTLAASDDMEAVFFGSRKRVRAPLGVESFGMQVIDLPLGATQYPRHDHAHDSQEEVFLVLWGSGEIEIDGERHPLTPEVMVRVGLESKRKIWPGEEGIRLLVLGGRPGHIYEPPEISKLGMPDPGLASVAHS